MRRGDRLFLCGGSDGEPSSYPIRVSFGCSSAARDTQAAPPYASTAQDTCGRRRKRDREAAEDSTASLAGAPKSRNAKEASAGGARHDAGGATEENIGEAGTALRCGCQRPDRAMREGTSLGVEMDQVVAGTAQTRPRAADSGRTREVAASFVGDSGERCAHTSSDAAATDLEGTEAVYSSTGREQEQRHASDGGHRGRRRGAATGKRRRDVSRDAGDDVPRVRTRTARVAAMDQPTQVATRGRTLGGDISRLPTRRGVKRRAEEREDGARARADAASALPKLPRRSVREIH